MKWISQDIDTYLSAKEFVDTAVIPLISISLNQEMKQSAAASEFITLLASHLERQFTGRLLLMPPFTYLKTEKMENAMEDLKKWEESIVQAGFKHVFYITSELDWRMQEGNFNGPIIWLPAIPLEQMNDSQKLVMIDSQVKQLLNIFTEKWHKN